LRFTRVIQESTCEASSFEATSFACAVHSRSACGDASTRVIPCARMCANSAVTQSTFCSMQRGMLQKVAALCGPNQREQVREALDLQAEIRLRAVCPLVLQALTVAAADVDPVEARR